MSISASIDLRLSPKVGGEFSSTDIVNAMTNNGWKTNYNKKTNYLPLGDDGLYNWKEIEISEETLMSIINQKETAKETIGLDLFWQDTPVGVTMLIFSVSEVSFNLSINRVKIGEIENINITDSSWYFSRILPSLNNGKIVVASFTFNQS